jgi:hypothetical protein
MIWLPNKKDIQDIHRIVTNNVLVRYRISYRRVTGMPAHIEILQGGWYRLNKRGKSMRLQAVGLLAIELEKQAEIAKSLATR